MTEKELRELEEGHYWVRTDHHTEPFLIHKYNKRFFPTNGGESIDWDWLSSMYTGFIKAVPPEDL